MSNNKQKNIFKNNPGGDAMTISSLLLANGKFIRE